LAKEGFTASRDIIEGPRGFSEVLSEQSNPDAALANLGQHLAVSDIVFKYHASCFETHPVIEAMLSIRKDRQPEPQEIESIRLQVSPVAVEVAGISNPQTGLEGKFSQLLCAALAWADGNTSQDAFTDSATRDPGLLDLMAKMALETVPDFSPTRCVARICLKDGSTLDSDVDVLSIPRSAGEKRRLLIEKYQSLAAPAIGSSEAADIAEAILQIDEMEGLHAICASCQHKMGATP
jgi:2-methylcitrate dehydratase PrpD